MQMLMLLVSCHAAGFGLKNFTNFEIWLLVKLESDMRSQIANRKHLAS